MTFYKKKNDREYKVRGWYLRMHLSVKTVAYIHTDVRVDHT
jgi:hypothetical protein